MRETGQGAGIAAADLRVADPAGARNAPDVPAQAGAEGLDQPVLGEGGHGSRPGRLQLGREAAAQITDREVAAEGADLEPHRLGGAVLEVQTKGVSGPNGSPSKARATLFASPKGTAANASR